MRPIRHCVLTSAAVLLPATCATLLAQSPYGLAARQTIPFVISQASDKGPLWSTEITVHNPGTLAITVSVSYLGAVGSATPGLAICPQLVVQPGGTEQAQVSSLCSLNAGFNYGKLELSALRPPPNKGDDPAADLFLASARLRSPTEYFTVEGFPQGNLSGNKAYAAVTGLKSGLVGGNQWQSSCFAAGLNETTPVFFTLVDGTGSPVGPFVQQTTLQNSASGMRVWDAFAAVNAPPGNYDNVTAKFSTALTAGQGGAAVFAFCELFNATLNQVTFSVAKYVDNNDEERQHRTTVSENLFGEPFWINAETVAGNISPNNWTNLHIAYFQHPDRVRCEVAFNPNPQVPYFDLGQIRLIDPEGHVVAGGPHATFFEAELGEKSTVHKGRNGRWLIEVAPDRTIKTGGNFSYGETKSPRNYTLSCSSSNGQNQLEIGGHCFVTCAPDPNDKKYFLCALNTPFKSGTCLE